MKIAIIQAELIWADGPANRMNFESAIDAMQGVDLVVMPEMFTTGFCTEPSGVAEVADGETLEWMVALARRKCCAVAGSVAVEQDGRFYNRFYFVRPDGSWSKYDKRHCFTFGGEHHHYTPGQERVVVEYMGWRILLQVCYDLRFPVFSRNRSDYDLALYVASWPVPRVDAWSALLRARAIENLSYVVGLNRVGSDPYCQYNGSSAILDFRGVAMQEVVTDREAVITATLDRGELEAFRAKFPAMDDGDGFEISL